jgi:hypothetical protein
MQRDTRLVRFGARDDDPHAGRWTTKDPVMFDSSGTNVYEKRQSTDDQRGPKRNRHQL